MGIRFQTEPRAEPSEIFIHVRMLDKDNVRQQEALGVIGVNLIYGAFYFIPSRSVVHSLDNLTWERVEVDMIRFAGPAFAEVDNRLMALQLVEKDLTEAAMFTAEGEASNGARSFKKTGARPARQFSSVDPPMLDMLERAAEQFIRERSLRANRPIVSLGNDPAPVAGGRCDRPSGFSGPRRHAERARQTGASFPIFCAITGCSRTCGVTPKNPSACPRPGAVARHHGRKNFTPTCRVASWNPLANYSAKT